MVIDQESDYWKALRDAMNTRASNEYRATAAAQAIAMYNTQTDPILAVGTESLGTLDSTVTALIESAYRIKDQHARAGATETARQARGVQAAFASLLPLHQRRFQLQLAVLRDMVDERGSVSAIASSRHRSEELKTLLGECDQKWQEAADHWQKTKDTFSALKGQFDLKSYPGRWESDSAAVATSP